MNCLLGNYLEETNGVPAEKYRYKCTKNCTKRGVMKYKKEMLLFTREREDIIGKIIGKQRTDMYEKIYYGNRRREKILRRKGQHRLYIG